jgi:hypothetical protein
MTLTVEAERQTRELANYRWRRLHRARAAPGPPRTSAGLKRRIDVTDTREATRADAAQVAIEHVQVAIDALELASQK